MDNFKEFMQDNFSWVTRLFRSTRFWALFFSALAVSGLDIPPEWQAGIYFLAAFTYAGTTAYEDAAQKGAAVEVVFDTPAVELDVEDIDTPVE